MSMHKGILGQSDGGCGITVLSDFRNKGMSDWYVPRYSEKTFNDFRPAGGAGWVLVPFINTPECRKMRELCDARWPIVYESRKRVNRNSGNKFWFVIYDASNKGKAKYGYDDDDAWYPEVKGD